MSDRVNVNAEDISALKTALETAGSEFVENYKKLERIMDDITKGNIKGELADLVLKKYQSKKPQLDGLKKEIETASEYAKEKGDALNRLTDNLISMIK